MNINVLFFILLAISLSSTLLISWFHHQYMQLKAPTRIRAEKIQHDGAVIAEPSKGSKPSEGSEPSVETSTILEAHLSCEPYGGPSDAVAQKMVYWSDIPKDAQFVSPYKKRDTQQYLVFEPDGGGWNNIR